MESSLFIELKIACVDSGCSVGLTPAGNVQIQIWVSQEMDSNWRWSKAYVEVQITLH